MQNPGGTPSPFIIHLPGTGGPDRSTVVGEALAGGMDTPGAPHAWEDLIGGKARSLVRLAALGLPTPPAIAISRRLLDGWRETAPPLPPDLSSLDDVTALEAARASLLVWPYPREFDEALAAALDGLALREAARQGMACEAPMPCLFAVRSSGDTEDRAGALGAGVYSSLVRVRQNEVAEAIRRVLASFLTPAAWAYARTRRTRNEDPTAEPHPLGAVLIHPFIEGTAGVVVAVPSSGRAETDQRRSNSGGARTDTRLTFEAEQALDPAVEAQLRAGAVRAARPYGAVELEWVASPDTITFVQLRAHRPLDDAETPRGLPDDDRRGQSRDELLEAMDPMQPGGPWIWDAAHNPGPLSPAQAGLVKLVDGSCALPFRQRVLGGYLFYRPDTHCAFGSGVSSPSIGDDPAVLLAQLAKRVNDELNGLADPPSLDDVLRVYVAAYAQLYAVIGPACAAARHELAAFLTRAVAEAASTTLPSLLLGVTSVATERQRGAEAIVHAPNAETRRAAAEAYLSRFGDESPRWDVAEPTLRETPERLLTLSAHTVVGPRESALADTQLGPRAAAAAGALRQRMSPEERPRFDRLLARARQAVAVGEDDDALFARLQAAVRAALLARGRDLVAANRLDVSEDIFFLPLELSLELARSASRDQVTFRSSAQSDGSDGTTGGAEAARADRAAVDLKATATEGRLAYERALSRPPRLSAPSGRRCIWGEPGASGQAIGRAVHYPIAAPLDRDAILVAASLLPTELPLLVPLALVVETGHALGHVAAQARERGLPAVVGLTDARHLIPAGTRVLVDGARGEVVLLDDEP